MYNNSKSSVFSRIRVAQCILLVALVIGLVPGSATAAPSSRPAFQSASFPVPAVAIHVSELTQALETMPAVSPTPTGSGTTGNQWWPTWWHYFVMYESLKEALRSDGTPYVTVSDADIAAGGLLSADGSPKYPIVISLASEAINNAEVTALRNYVSSGGFLFAGSSAFTRNPDGTTRGDFALSTEMGLHMVTAGLQNWSQNSTLTKVVDHRLVSHIPSGTLAWDMPLTSEDIPLGISPAHTTTTSFYVWRVNASDATVIANGDAGPILATKTYGKGQFIFHGAMQPLLGFSGLEAGMYSYVIYRNAIEWAFESAGLPIIKLSPWQYAYDSAFVVRHDYENDTSLISSIETSAQYEHSVGAKGDYYFTTGVVRIGSADTRLSNTQKTQLITSLQRAVSAYGATIGSHNGGLKNPVNSSLASGDYDYWHWGPDEALNTTPAGYANGRTYAYTSIYTSFLDIQGWLSGLDNGRVGCGAAGNCPRTWVSPYFNSAREGSLDILGQIGTVSAGEQKIGPFPHWTLSTQTAGKRYSSVTLPVSDWFIDTTIAQSMEDRHTVSTVRALVDFYYNLGALVNLYGHSVSSSGVEQEYVTYSAAKPRIWATNAVGIYDWWRSRSNVVVTPTYSTSGGTVTAGATIAGATDVSTTVEIVIPKWTSGGISNLQVLFNGSPANPADYRTTSTGLKVRVGTTVTNVQVRYTPLNVWTQTSWAGGAGQATWADATRYDSGNNINNSVVGEVRLGTTSGSNTLYSDDFSRQASSGPARFNWVAPTTNATWPNRGVFTTTGGVLNASTSVANNYGFAYTNTQTLTDGSVEADIRFPQANTYGGGVFGRLNASNGQRYGVWVYPEVSSGGTATMMLIKFNNDWGSWNSPGLQTVSIPGVGTNWHHLKLSFTGNRMRVYYDGTVTPTIDVTDTNSDGHGLYTSGYAGVDFYTVNNTNGPVYNNFVVRDASDAVVLSDDFGADTVNNPLLPWTTQQGTWAVTNGALRGTGTTNQYAYAYYSSTVWADYSVEGRIQFPAGAYGGGLGGRLNASTGAHYAVWIYPDGSAGGSNVLRLMKFTGWGQWSGSVMQQVSLSSVGTGYHTLRLAFSGNRIQVYYDGTQVADVTDNGFDSQPAYLSGGISADMWVNTSPYTMVVDDVSVVSSGQYVNNGTLLSSAFDGGAGVQWKTVSWDTTTNANTSVSVRTRTANQVDQLSAAPWSAYYTASGSPVTSANSRWIQYELGLTTTDTSSSPILSEIRVTYVTSQTSSVSYTLAVNVVGNGSVSRNPDLATYSDGDLVALTATPANGWVFAGWSGAISGSTNPTVVTMDASKSVTATFIQGNSYALTVNVVGGGTVARQPDQSSYASGTVVTLMATPTAGWTFVGWSGDASGSQAQTTVTMATNRTVTATFTQQQYTLAVNVVGGGTVARQPDQSSYASGTVVTLTATPTAGWTFVGWSGDASGSQTQTTVTMAANRTVTATFTPQQQYTLAVNVVGGGTVAQQPDQSSYASGTVVTLTATPTAGWTFVGWSGDASGSQAQTTVTMAANRTVTATFTPQQYTLAVNVVGGGTVAQQPDQSSYASGTVVTLTATPTAGWTFAGWSGDLTGSVNPQVIAITGNKVVTVTFTATTSTTLLYSDDFSRQASSGPVRFNWITPTTNATWPNRGVFTTTGGVLNASTSVANNYGFAYTNTQTIMDGSVEADIRFPQANTYGGGVFGRLNASNGQRYGVWVYPEVSSGGTATIKLIKFYNDWGSFNMPGFETVNIPGVGTNWHHLKLSFTGNRIRVYYDGTVTPTIDVTDTNSDGHGLYTSGYAGVDFYAWNNTNGPVYNNFVVRDASDAVVLSDDFGTDTVNPLLPWTTQQGTWAVTNGALRGTGTTNQYAYAYYSSTVWADYSVEGRIQFPAGAYGGGLGGRLNSSTGAHYAAWIYPDGSAGGSNVLRLVKFTGWGQWSGSVMQQVSLSSVGTGYHTLRLAFSGNRIQVYYDGTQVADVTDNGFDSQPAYLSGGISADMWVNTSPYTMVVDDVSVISGN